MIDAFQSGETDGQVSTGEVPKAEMDVIAQKAEALEAGTFRNSLPRLNLAYLLFAQNLPKQKQLSNPKPPTSPHSNATSPTPNSASGPGNTTPKSGDASSLPTILQRGTTRYERKRWKSCVGRMGH